MLHVPCGGQGVHIPMNECDDCSTIKDRVKALEEKLENLEEVPFCKYENDGSVTHGTVLGRLI